MPDKTRSESDILLKELKLNFGEKEYVVPVLRSRESAKWREQYFKTTKEVSDAMPMKFEQEHDPQALQQAIGRGLMGALLEFPNKVPDLVMSYANSLTDEQRAAILEEAYDQDWARAYKQVWEVAFAPFLGSLGMVLEMQRSQASRSASPGAMN